MIGFFVRMRRSNVFEGTFDSFEGVRRLYALNTAYDSGRQTDISLERLKTILSLYRTGQYINFEWDTHRFNLLAMATLDIDGNGGPMKILDIGGGFGLSYLNLIQSRKFSQRGQIEYVIYDLPSIASFALKEFDGFKNLWFISDLPAEGNHFDLVIFGSSLQYFEDYSSILDQVINYSPKRVMIADTLMSSADSFVCAQVNMPKRYIPMHVFNTESIRDFFIRNGYEISLFNRSYYPFHDLSNYDQSELQLDFYNCVCSKL